MKNERILSAFSYMSIFFCPVIVPIVVYFAQDDEYVRFHAKRAFIGQAIVTASLLLFIALFFFGAIAAPSVDTTSFLLLGSFAIIVIASLLVALWSIIMTVRVFR